MKEHPILFSAPMVRALLDGSKTQTRRAFNDRTVSLMRAAASAGEVSWFMNEGRIGKNDLPYILQFCPFGKVGDQLWVRETWQAWHKSSYEYDEWEAISVVQASASKSPEFEFGPTCDAIEYRATSKSVGPWTPSIHMPRWASRIQLEITCVRVERMNNISEADALAEGVTLVPVRPQYAERMGRDAYVELWESINGAGSWDANPWVWVIEFRITK